MIYIKLEGNATIKLPESIRNKEIIAGIESNDFICNPFIAFDNILDSKKIINMNKVVSIDCTASGGKNDSAM